MHTNEIRDAIAEEIRRLTIAHAALNGGMPRRAYVKRGAPAKKKRHMSAAVKRRLSLKAKQRWKAAKAAGKTQL